jgi:hypothetical protein
MSKDRRVGVSQEGRINVSTRSTRDLAGANIPSQAPQNNLIFSVPSSHHINNMHSFFSNAVHANKEDEYQLRQISTKLNSEPAFV